VLTGKIAECTLCHSHPETPDVRVNRFSKSLVGSCARCHAAGVPAKGEVVEVDRSRLVLEGGYQRHEGEAKCSACHQVVPQAFATGSKPSAEPERLAIAVSTKSGSMETPHDARIAKKKQVRGTPEEAELIQYFYNEGSCVECHWHDASKCQDAYVLNAARQTQNPLVRALLSDRNWRDEYRAKLGADFDGALSGNAAGFPGIGPSPKR
jgi:hypothetical protein